MWLPRLQILAAAVLFSTGGAAIKGCSWNAWQVAGLRSGIAVVAMVSFMRAARHGYDRRSSLVGLALAATLVLFVVATKWTTSANAIFLEDTSPAYVLVLSPWLLGERFRVEQLVVLALVALGMLLLFLGTPQPLATAPAPAFGNALALLAGVSWALTVMGLRWLRVAAAPAVVMGNLFAFLLLVPFAFPMPTAGLRAADVGLIVYLGVFQVALGYVLLVRAAPHVRALDIALLLLLEPVLNPVWSWLALGENPGGLAVAGGACILGGGAFQAFRSQRAESGAENTGFK